MTVQDALRPGWRERLALLVQTLQTWPWLDTLRTLRQRFREDRLGVTASSLSFTTMIALVPLATVTLAIFSAFPMFSQFQGALEKYFIQSLVPEAIARPVLTALQQFAGKANRLGAAGLLILGLTALALMLTIDRTLNAIWRVRKPRPIAQRVLVYWAAATLGPLLLGVSLTLTSYAISASRGLVGAMPGGLGLLLDGLQFVLLAGAMAGLFHYVPNTDVRWRHALSGGVFVAAGFELAKKGLAWYLEQVPTYATVYGAFATLPIFLVWIYLGWVIVLLGAVIAAYAPSLSMHIVRRPNTPGQRFALAVQLLRELAQARALATHGLAAPALAVALRADPLQVEALLEVLVGIDWVGRLDEEGERRYVLLADPAGTPAQPLLAAVLLDPTPAVQAFWQHAGFGDLKLDAVIR
ncbi:YihY family inner membrane protein [uncultured Methylibium sp.]|uniref:YihY family inner membrane protein n=1 Tax=uncultured Methylibium sp. TaxID=381093 RepID=UPI0025EF6D06|nr:YihY family inner membrane protein [uncultured Methylibium sp.]